MHCFRLTRHPELSGEGGRRYAGRWHGGGRPIVYTAQTDALAILEVRVNLDIAFDLLPSDYWLVRIEIVDGYAVEQAQLRAADPETAAFGDAWLAASSRGERAGALSVPSIVAPYSRNLLLNPQAPNFETAVRMKDAVAFAFDPRLWRGA
jgi:RES domain-containing protein